MSDPTLTPATAMAAFHTRSQANEGIQVFLSLPDGTPSEHWLRIRGVDSDVYRREDGKARRKAMEIAQEKDEDKREEMIDDTRLAVQASLVSEWSFSEPCSLSAVKAFLREAPQVAELVDRTSFQRALFFAKGSTPSSSSPAKASS